MLPLVSCLYVAAYTRKNAQVATDLQTSCNKSVHKLFTSCSQDAFAPLVPNLLEQVWNKLLTNCNKLDGTIRPVTKLLQQELQQLQPCVVNPTTVTALCCQSCNKLATTGLYQSC